MKYKQNVQVLLCSLFPYRFGRVPGHKSNGNINNLNKI